MYLTTSHFSSFFSSQTGNLIFQPTILQPIGLYIQCINYLKLITIKLFPLTQSPITVLSLANHQQKTILEISKNDATFPPHFLSQIPQNINKQIIQLLIFYVNLHSKISRHSIISHHSPFLGSQTGYFSFSNRSHCKPIVALF